MRYDTEEEEYFVEMTWDCPNSPCNNRRIPGHSMECPNCGYKKQSSANDKMPENLGPENKVTDSEKLSEAKAGANWKCSYCHGEERNTKGECLNCGGDKKDSVPTTREPEEPEESTPPPIAKASRNLPSAFDAVTSYHKKVTEHGGYSPEVNKQNLLIVIGGLLAMGALIWLCVWLFTPHIHHAKVIQTHWHYHVELEQRVVNSGTDWQGDMHSGAYNVSCDTRQHGTHNCNPYDCNPHRVNHPINPHRCHCETTPRSCGEPVCTTQRNGYARCRRSCTPAHTECDTCYDDHYVTEYDTCYHQCPTMDQWCSYNYDTWPVVARDDRAGDDHTIVRPPLVASGADQRTTESLTFHVRMQRHDDEFHDYTPTSLSDYNRFQLGTRWRIETTHAGGFRPIQAGQ